MVVNLQKVARLSKMIYEISAVVDTFCKNDEGILELQQLTPVVGYLRDKADRLYAECINGDLYKN